MIVLAIYIVLHNSIKSEHYRSYQIKKGKQLCPKSEHNVSLQLFYDSL